MPTPPAPEPGRPPRAEVPDGLPVPGRFAHLHPDDGACLMEAASLLATGRFTDHPPGTHPVLAALARAVNDSVDDATRRTLWPLAADLADAGPADRAYGPLLVGTVVDAARRVRPGSRRLECRSAACRARARRLARARTRRHRPASPTCCGGTAPATTISNTPCASCSPPPTPTSACPGSFIEP